ncbi:MAG: hypothetical protein LC720_00210 [Actinobacteria bacterium]|nr:hypothetical protein [Actinomycetota bacterium]
MHRVLFFGDDVVAAVTDPSGLGFVGRLACAASRVGVPVVAFNLGVPGETSVDVSRRWRKEAAPRVLLGEPWRPVFCFGANDTALEERRTRVEPAASIQALQKVLARSLHWLDFLRPLARSVGAAGP